MPDSDEGQMYQVGPDDCISSIAQSFGFLWKTLWFHPNNADLRALRKDPNVLMEGDQIFIPTKGGKQESKPTDGTHSFVRKGVPAKLRLRLMKDNEPRANQPYVLTIDANILNGTTDGDGKIEIFIPPGAQSGRIRVGQGSDQQSFDLDLGHMNPVTETSGVIQRLENLGYHCGLDKQTGWKRALRSFQADNNLPTDAGLDEATKTKLVEVHGC